MAAAAQVIRRCRALAMHSELAGETTRTFLCTPMHSVHVDVAAWMTDAGMAVHVDAAGNIRGLYEAAAPGAPRLVIGSHLDTVPRAGAFDGILGVMIGIALVESLGREAQPFGIEVIGFSEEEGVRFGVPFIGSRAVAGSLDDELLSRVDPTGASVVDAIRQFGLDPSALPSARIGGPTIGYLEFHIEQGPVLDRLGLPLGVVSAIAGQTRAEVVFAGVSGHAGTTPMAARADAVAGAAEWVLAVEREAVRTPGLVATVGRVEPRPNAGNVIAGDCLTSLDARHVDDGVRAAAIERLRATAHELASRRRLGVTWSTRLDQPAVTMDASLVAALTRAVERSGAPVFPMPSGAGHDAMVMATQMPAAMLFLRTPGGLSHHPDESVAEGDVAAALAAGAALLDDLAASSHA